MKEISAMNAESSPERVNLPKDSWFSLLEGLVEKYSPESGEVAKTGDWWQVLEDAADAAFDNVTKFLDIDLTEKESVSENPENKYLSTYEERINQTPTDKNTERGQWEGTRGESKYVPADKRIQEILAQYKRDGIEYKNGIPDFSSCSESTVEIDNMSENRQGKGGNFEQADQKCAEQWNKERRDGKTDWTARDVANWRRENNYSWHECNDRKTCQLIPTAINDYFGHLGGVGECSRANAKEAEFDE